MILILSSPSGAGKTTLTRMLMQDKGLDLTLSVSVTTRPRRSSEVDGIHYRFIDRREFDRMRTAGDLLEWAGVFGWLVRRGRDSRHPGALHPGGMLDQAADRQRADRGCGPGLFIGKAVGDGEIRALVVGEKLAEGMAFVGDGRGEGGHSQSS